MPWLYLSTAGYIVYAIVALMSIGALLGALYLIARAFIAIVFAVPLGVGRLWHWITNTAADTYGSARWSREKDLERAGLFGQPGMRLGAYAGKELTLRDGHCAIIGSTMSGNKPIGENWGGKTSGHAIPTLLQWKGSAVVLDIRGDIWTPTAAYRATLGRVVRWCPTDAKSISINLGDAIRWDSDMESADHRWPRPPLHRWGIAPTRLNPSSGRRLRLAMMPKFSTYKIRIWAMMRTHVRLSSPHGRWDPHLAVGTFSYTHT